MEDNNDLIDDVSTNAELTSDEKNMAMLCHVLGLLTGFIGPLIIWLMKKDESKFIDYHGKEALNFIFTMIIAYIISAILVVIFIGVIMMAIVGIASLVLLIMAGIKASSGEYYKYPFSIKFLS